MSDLQIPLESTPHRINKDASAYPRLVGLYAKEENEHRVIWRLPNIDVLQGKRSDKNGNIVREDFSRREIFEVSPSLFNILFNRFDRLNSVDYGRVPDVEQLWLHLCDPGVCIESTQKREEFLTKIVEIHKIDKESNTFSGVYRTNVIVMGGLRFDIDGKSCCPIYTLAPPIEQLRIISKIFPQEYSIPKTYTLLPLEEKYQSFMQRAAVALELGLKPEEVADYAQHGGYIHNVDSVLSPSII